MSRKPKNFKDLTGMEFGRLTVIEIGPRKITASGQYKTQWWCNCSCGNPDRILVGASALNSGRTQSCGCLQKERTSAVKRKQNRYVIGDEYVTGYTHDGIPFYFDIEDYDLVSQFSWHKTSNGYIATRDRMDNDTPKKLHRVLMSPEKDELVDHINHDKKDNRRCNLRVVNRFQSQRNRGLSKLNTSGVQGVTWKERDQKWVAMIYIKGKYKYLGGYKNFSDAVAARKAAEEKYFGEYSYDNSIAAVPRIDAHTDQIVAAAG